MDATSEEPADEGAKAAVGGSVEETADQVVEETRDQVVGDPVDEATGGRGGPAGDGSVEDAGDDARDPSEEPDGEPSDPADAGEEADSAQDRGSRAGPKQERARAHLRGLGGLALAALGVAAYVAATTYTAGDTLGTAPAWVWLGLAAAGLLGGVLNRMTAIGFEAYRNRTYEPADFPLDLVLAFRAPLVAGTLVVLLPDRLVGPDSSAFRAMAVVFVLSYFGDPAFERLRDLVRVLLGKDVDSDKPKRPLVHGVDLPIWALRAREDILKDYLKRELGEDVSLDQLLAGLRGAGIEYSHEVLELADTEEGRDRLREQANLDDEQIDALVRLLDLARAGIPLSQAAALAGRGLSRADELPRCRDAAVAEARAEQEGQLDEGELASWWSAEEIRERAPKVLDPG